MLEIVIPSVEIYNEAENEFYNIRGQTLIMEHSLVSLAKWESKWCKPFLTKEKKTYSETTDYIRCMTISQNVDPNLYKVITNDIIDKVSVYIDSPMTATTFSKNQKGTINRDTITAEVIYYWMIALNIPFECQKWHLNRLLTLINVCNIKNQPDKKLSRKDILSRNHAINAARRAKLNSGG